MTDDAGHERRTSRWNWLQDVAPALATPSVAESFVGSGGAILISELAVRAVGSRLLAGAAYKIGV